ncbi:adenylate cyclase [Desulfobaculum xiamenense]|uniref:Adenylate cyclase n=1 Tax=Desulfobaculum xiamenense TaxID=995050 RepID=A0A846QN97_9BACT|nr:adenylate/guanylate cyclase domain-containing protein [Desulfobaculum xiamenense]NJB67932.1 adenylate cyclase [Desulfobaculum xiamenense]
MSFFRELSEKMREMSAPDELMGEVLTREGVITEAQLAKAVEHQQAAEQRGEPENLAKAVVCLGFAEEGRVLGVLNRAYGIEAKSVDEDIEKLIEEQANRNFFTRMRVPIRFKLSVTLAFFLLLSMFVLSYFLLQRQANNLYKESIKAGKISLTYFADEAKVPIINEDTLRLNSLVRKVTEVEGLLYAAIVDRENLTLAHNDLQKVGKPLTLPGRVGAETQEGNLSYFRRVTVDGREILNMSSPVTFQGKELGTVHVGISLDFIQDRIAHEKVFIYVVTVAFFLAGMAVAGLLGTNFSRPISRLVVATREISSGNYHHKVDFKRKDEFGDLARAFNFMSHELWLKSIMRESFGRYVSTTIRDLILADPQSVWLKGVRNEATIMFADVRGFTKYSEAHEPEVVVEQLNEFFDTAAKYIAQYGGYIDKFIGDEVLAVFGGLPNSTGDHAQNAVRASWAMQQELASRASDRNPVLGRVGVSINTGTVVSGNIGSEVRMEYTVIGDSVNVASRLNGLAGPGEIVLSESTFERVQSFVAASQLQPQMVKGKTAPLQPYSVDRVLAPDEGPAPPPKLFSGTGVAAPPPPKAGPAAAAPPPPPKTRPVAPSAPDAGKTAAPRPSAPKPAGAKPAGAKPAQPAARPAPKQAPSASGTPQDTQQRPAPKPGPPKK